MLMIPMLQGGRGQVSSDSNYPRITVLLTYKIAKIHVELKLLNVDDLKMLRHVHST